MRVCPNVLHRIYPRTGLDVTGGTIYGLTETRTSQFESMDSFRLWVRTMPRWPNEQCYQLVCVSPVESWDDTNHLFHGLQDGVVNAPRILVFRKKSSNHLHAYFIVFLRAEIAPTGGNFIKRRLRCNVMFGQWEKLDQQDLNRHVESLGPSIKIAEAQGEGLVLKCYAKHESVSGQPLYCADLYVKPV
jgi:hypothetical protein